MSDLEIEKLIASGEEGIVNNSLNPSLKKREMVGTPSLCEREGRGELLQEL